MTETSFVTGQSFRKAWWLATAFGVCVGVSGSANAQEAAPAADADITEANPAEAQKLEAGFISRTRQLTFEGRRAGEVLALRPRPEAPGADARGAPGT